MVQLARIPPLLRYEIVIVEIIPVRQWHSRPLILVVVVLTISLTRRGPLQTRKDSPQRRPRIPIRQPTPLNNLPQLLREPKAYRIPGFHRTRPIYNLHHDRS